VRVHGIADELAAVGVEPVAVGFSPPEALASLADHLAWPFPFLSDVDRVLYRRLGLGRAPLKDVYTPATMAVYAKAAARGEKVAKPVEDTRQLGGDALAVAGVARVVLRPSSPDDRPDVADLLDRARRLPS
jgi:hypothetical protein